MQEFFLPLLSFSVCMCVRERERATGKQTDRGGICESMMVMCGGNESCFVKLDGWIEQCVG